MAVNGFPMIGGGAGPPQARRAAAPAPAALRANGFDAPGAFAIARRLVGFGPRPAGSPAERRSAAYLRALLPHGRFEPVPGGLRNIAGELPGSGRPIAVIAHYDTTPVAGYLGANNSAAAVGAVVEIGRALRAQRTPPGAAPVVLLLTDGEEAPDYPPADFERTALRGSRAAASGPYRHARAAIVLDFVGQRGLRIPRELNSDAGLWAKLRAAARSVGAQAVFPGATQEPILDDHIPFKGRGIPAIDLIDFDYPCWQKRCDTLDKLSPRSIDAAGETVLALVRSLRRDTVSPSATGGPTSGGQVAASGTP
ncbi:MAG TPA: M28 family peptidase [Solirubrobacteraceae bacterium]|nr:M28 family peptidase [Solirubrobacteraceae bacterium]